MDEKREFIKYFYKDETMHKICIELADLLKEDTYPKGWHITTFNRYKSMRKLLDKIVKFLNEDIIGMINKYSDSEITDKFYYDNNTLQLLLVCENDFFENEKLFERFVNIVESELLNNNLTEENNIILSKIYDYILNLVVYPNDDKQIIYYQGYPYKLGLSVYDKELNIGLCDVKETDEKYFYIHNISNLNESLGFKCTDKTVVMEDNKYYAISIILEMNGIGNGRLINDEKTFKTYTVLSFTDDDLSKMLGYEKYKNVLNNKNIF